jgi:hypothetical protein
MNKKENPVTPKEYRDLLGKEIKCFNRIGFIAAIHPEIGITIKPLYPTKNDGKHAFTYCFDSKTAKLQFDKKVAKQMFESRIQHLRKNNSINDAQIIRMDKELGYTHNGAGSGSCPFK